MKLPLIILVSALVPISAWAQQQSAPRSPELQATEAALLQQITAARDWHAQAIELSMQNQSLTKQLADANAQLEKAAPAAAAPNNK